MASQSVVEKVGLFIAPRARGVPAEISFAARARRRKIASKIMTRLLLTVFLLALAAPRLLAQTASLPSAVYKSVLRIEVATQVPDYQTPWNSGRCSGGIGTGFLIGKN